jgi:hypothetical protein
MKPLNSFKSFSYFFVVTMFFILTSCTKKEDQLMSPSEANQKILTTMAIKDGLCNTQHSLTLPVFTDVHMDSVAMCVQSILVIDCTAWGTDANLPATCNMLVLNK